MFHFFQVIFLLGYGLDAPPRKLLLQSKVQVGLETSADHVELKSLTAKSVIFSWRRVIKFLLWASIWTSYVLVLCAISMKEYGGLGAMFKRYDIIIM